jgi:hypothetical protein
MINLSKNKAATADTYLDGTKPIAKQSKKDLESQLFNIRVELMERDRMEKEAQAKAKRAAERKERQPLFEWLVWYKDGTEDLLDTDIGRSAPEDLAEALADPKVEDIELKRTGSTPPYDLDYTCLKDGEFVPCEYTGRFKIGTFIVPKKIINQLKRAKAMAESI